MKEKKTIWMISREYDGLAGAGGVKDVCRQLSEVLAKEEDCAVSVILPRYGFMSPEKLGFVPVQQEGTRPGMIGEIPFENCFQVTMNYSDLERRETVALWQNSINKVTVYLLEAERFAEKKGVYTYTEEEEQVSSWKKKGSGHYDYFAMNILLQKAALDFMLLSNTPPWIIHCQDGHAATLPAMMRENSGYRQFFARTGAVVTVHNAGLGYHQEIEDLEFAEAVTELPASVVNVNRLGASFNPFIAASRYALVNTVSENYGRELQESSEDVRTGWLGHTLKESGVTLEGVTNGIDPESFNPKKGSMLGLAAGFDIPGGDLKGKAVCKKQLLQQTVTLRQWEYVEQFGTLSLLPEAPLLTFIGRLTEQKGIDVVLSSIKELFQQSQGVQLLILGSGNGVIEENIQMLVREKEFQGRLCLLKGYDPLVANQVYAAGDFFLIPSLYEPCGLTDYIAQLMGNLPIVHHVGGLVKVIDNETGFAYSHVKGETLVDALYRALAVYRQPAKLLKMQQTSVKNIHARHSWKKVMHKYIHLYEQAGKLVS